MTNREELIRAMTIALSMAIDIKEEDVVNVHMCDCPVCTTFKGALAIYDELKAQARRAGECLH